MSESKPKPRIKLPFEPQKVDAGEWAYNNRFGLIIAFAISILFLLAAVVVTIEIQNYSTYSSIIIDLENEILEPEPVEEKKIEEKLSYEQVQNTISNENALGLNHELRDDRGAPAEQIYESVEQVNERLRASRELYQAGLAAEAEILALRDGKIAEVKNSDIKTEGLVTVSFSFNKPIRNSVHLVTPAYMCQGGGRVVVNATLDNSGRVIAVSINSSTNTSDNCMREAALSSAKNSRFNLDTDAPIRHQGTITYVFIPQ